MAERRMFSKTIIDSDVFLDMPLSAQALYFHLSMRADDDGFVNNPRKIQRMIGCAEDDLKLLVAKQFLIVFESGVVVIKHWKIHNYIRSDRYKPTIYQAEMKQIAEDENRAYVDGMTLGIPDGTQVGYQMEPQYRLGKDSIGKVSIDKDIEPVADAPAKPKKSSSKSFDELIDEYTENAELRGALRDYVQMRTAIRKKMTNRALELAFKELDKLAASDWEKIAIVNQSVLNSWQGLFPLKDQGAGRRMNNGANNGGNASQDSESIARRIGTYL